MYTCVDAAVPKVAIRLKTGVLSEGCELGQQFSGVADKLLLTFKVVDVSG